MDNTNILHGKKQHRVDKIHPLPRGIREIHKKYGLWICRFTKKLRTFPKREFVPRVFKFYCVSHLVAGDGKYWNAKTNSFKSLSSGEGIMTSPDFIQVYGARETYYEEDSICFAGPIADALFKTGIIKDGIVRIGEQRSVAAIIDKAMDPADDSQIAANLALQNFLVELYLDRQKHQNRELRDHGVKELIAEIQEQADKWWTVSSMADFCNLSEMQFRRVFRKITGYSPKNYIEEIKVRLAAERLLSSEDRIADVAAAFGYQDPFHFSKRFKERTGYSPQAYRKNF